MKIKDIYAGKPDASDEIREKGYEEFRNNYIEPAEVDVNQLASTKYGTPIFIMGDKGTGKTALLHFLEHYVREIDEAACSSFVSFEKNYTQIQREKFNIISQSISTSISIDNSIATRGTATDCDYLYIWKWQFFQKIIDDNSAFNEGLFEDDDNWCVFKSEINKIEKTVNDKRKMQIPAIIKFSASANPQTGTFTPGVSIEPVDLSERSFNKNKSYKEFVDIIESASMHLKDIVRTDIPYYIFVDELEAYRGDDDTFYRDLQMIRDLLFTVKELNDVLGTGTKIICSVRPEIINAINRFVQPKQLHKITQGYEERLVWEHTNTNSFSHPIMNILLKRIETAEKKNKDIERSALIEKWFKKNVYNTNICTYILDNTWHKPRDIIRLLLSAQANRSKNFERFDQNAFDTFMPYYSKQSLIEIMEEMRALYTSSEIEEIFRCIQGYKSKFSFHSIKERALLIDEKSIIATSTLSVLNDMYRIGIIGNLNSKTKSQRWEYKQQYKLLIDNPWEMIVHPALRIELSVSGKNLNSYIKTETVSFNNQEVYIATVKKIKEKYIKVTFNKNGYIEKGYISIRNLSVEGVEPDRIDCFFNLNDKIKVRIIKFNKYFNNWVLSIVP